MKTQRGSVKRGEALSLDMKVSTLTVDPFTNLPILILKDEAGREALPIWIGLVEASAIVPELEKVELDRPQIHDLMTDLLGRLDIKLDRVEVHDLRAGTFYACLHLVGPGRKRMVVEARPSDAIALALRTGARISVARKVLASSQRIEQGAAPLPADDAHLQELLESLRDEEFGKWKM